MESVTITLLRFDPGGHTAMTKFIIGSFLMLGWGFYEMSGGADFVPETAPSQEAVASVEAPEAIPFDAPQVSRANLIAIPIAAEEEADLIVLASFEVAPAASVAEEAPLDLRAVSGKRVNMRSGPGTNYGVLDTLVRGTETEVIEVNGDGWARIRITQSGQIGWMAERLLSEI